MLKLFVILAAVTIPGIAVAEEMSGLQDANVAHMQHAHAMTSNTALQAGGTTDGVTEPGQSAFAAIQEIVAVLVADPATDWSIVDLESLRQHLIDMDNVTLRAEVRSVDVDGGVRFDVTSDIPAVAASNRRMVSAHAATMDGVQGWALHANDLSNGASLTVLGDDRERILGLGLIGMMALGMHHQAHHLALATGHSPH